jgi:hypothetical protein
MKVNAKVFIALWFDSVDKVFLVAGVYTSYALAWRRIKKLGNGTVQALKMNEDVVFTQEDS